MKPPLSTIAQRSLFIRLMAANSNKNTAAASSIIEQRRYAGGGKDPELMKIHNKLPANYKSFVSQMNIDNPAFWYDFLWKKQVDPSKKIPHWAYRGNAEVGDTLFVGPYRMWQILSATFWGWMIWRIYWGGYNVFFGEPEFLSSPDPSEWTDAELGIPDDDSMPERIYKW